MAVITAKKEQENLIGAPSLGIKLKFLLEQKKYN